MNTSPYSDPQSRPPALPASRGGQGPREVEMKRRSGPWLVSLTLVCFVFGGVLAMQLRAVERVRAGREQDTRKVAVDQQVVARMKLQFDKEKQNSVLSQHKMERDLQKLKQELATGSVASQKQVTLLSKQLALLTTQTKDLQKIAALTPLRGPGVRLVVSDNSEGVKLGVDPFLYLVHDFDLQQIVNELRAAKADAIAINGTRITGYTPIRCVGPVVYINWEPAASPFRIEALGDAQTLASALKMPGGIVDKLKTPQVGLPLGAEISIVRNLELPASESAPRMKVARTP